MISTFQVVGIIGMSHVDSSSLGLFGQLRSLLRCCTKVLFQRTAATRVHCHLLRGVLSVSPLGDRKDRGDHSTFAGCLLYENFPSFFPSYRYNCLFLLIY
jgi:hypothetical protein